MDYILLILADVLLALNFVTTKAYQVSEGISLNKGIKFNAFLGIISAVMFLLINNFKIEVNMYSLVMATLQAALCVAYTIIGFKIMAEEKMAVYTVFLMTGGMIVPYVWGITFLNEPLSFNRTIGLVIIVASICVLNLGSKKINLYQLLLCLGVFVINGFTSVIAKEHQISGIGISSIDFCTVNGIAKAVLCFIALPFTSKMPGEKQNTYNKRNLLLILATAVVSGISYLLQVMSAKELPATVVYPMITGGSIVLTTLSGRIFFKEKMTRAIIIGIVLCFVGTCMFL